MTEKTVINHMKSAQGYLVHVGYWRSFDIAIASLKKQIPQKPIKEEAGCFACSVCGSGDITTIGEDGDINGYLKYCGNCG